MTLTGYNDKVAYSRQRFEEGLIRAGFTEDNAHWRGTIVHIGGSTEVLIELCPRYPFQPPRVAPLDPDAVDWSWHRELDGSLCLVAEDDHEGLWWTEAPVFLEHVTAWFDQATAGWPDDRPDLDLDRYFKPSEDKHLYLYDDLTRYSSGFVRFRSAANNTMRIGNGTKPAKVSKRSNDRFGYVVNLGEVNVPPRTWDEVSARINPSVDLDRKIRNHTIEIVVLIYCRGNHDGAVALEVWPTAQGSIAVRRLRSSADTDAAKAARSGLLTPELRGCRVAIIGIGALGSFVTDMLVRAGVRHLTLVDGDVVMPGNLVRHLVGPEAIGRTKAKAVKDHVVARGGIESADVAVVNEALTLDHNAMELLTHHDLVVDATADFATTALLHVTAEALSKQIISTVIQNDGTSYRVDVLPALDGADPLPPSALATDQAAPELFEAGCGSPISPTPPHAVIEAAAATVRHAIGLLVGRPLHPAGEARDLLIGTLKDHE